MSPKRKSKAQYSIEFLTILGVVLLLLVFVAFIIVDIPGSFSSLSRSRDVAVWREAPVGILSVVDSGGVLSVTVVNNQRFEVLIKNVTLDGVLSSPVNVNIGAGNSTSFSLLSSAISSKALVRPVIVFVDTVGYNVESTIDLDYTYPITR